MEFHQLASPTAGTLTEGHRRNSGERRCTVEARAIGVYLPMDLNSSSSVDGSELGRDFAAAKCQFISDMEVAGPAVSPLQSNSRFLTAEEMITSQAAPAVSQPISVTVNVHIDMKNCLQSARAEAAGDPLEAVSPPTVGEEPARADNFVSASNSLSFSWVDDGPPLRSYSVPPPLEPNANKWSPRVGNLAVIDRDVAAADEYATHDSVAEEFPPESAELVTTACSVGPASSLRQGELVSTPIVTTPQEHRSIGPTPPAPPKKRKGRFPRSTQCGNASGAASLAHEEDLGSPPVKCIAALREWQAMVGTIGTPNSFPMSNPATPQSLGFNDNQKFLWWG